MIVRENREMRLFFFFLCFPPLPPYFFVSLHASPEEREKTRDAEKERKEQKTKREEDEKDQYRDEGK